MKPRPSESAPDVGVPPAAPTRCAVIPLDVHRRWLASERRDAAVNADWDRLLVLARDAWMWRDPESLATLEAHLIALKAAALSDWRR